MRTRFGNLGITIPAGMTYQTPIPGGLQWQTPAYVKELYDHAAKYENVLTANGLSVARYITAIGTGNMSRLDKVTGSVWGKQLTDFVARGGMNWDEAAIVSPINKALEYYNALQAAAAPAPGAPINSSSYLTPTGQPGASGPAGTAASASKLKTWHYAVAGGAVILLVGIAVWAAGRK